MQKMQKKHEINATDNSVAQYIGWIKEAKAKGGPV